LGCLGGLSIEASAPFALAGFVVYTLFWEVLLMTKQERQLIYDWDSRAAYWQYRQNPAEYEPERPYERANQETDDSWVLLLWVLGTIGILVLLVKTTVLSYF
jgi:hypothetical protein